MSDTRIVFADQLAAGDVLTDNCRGNDRSCSIREASRHEPGHVHERTILALRHGSTLIQGIAVDEDGEQQPLAWGANATIRIRVRDTFPAEQPEIEEAQP